MRATEVCSVVSVATVSRCIRSTALRNPDGARTLLEVPNLAPVASLGLALSADGRAVLGLDLGSLRAQRAGRRCCASPRPFEPELLLPLLEPLDRSLALVGVALGDGAVEDEAADPALVGRGFPGGATPADSAQVRVERRGGSALAPASPRSTPMVWWRRSVRTRWRAGSSPANAQSRPSSPSGSTKNVS